MQGEQPTPAWCQYQLAPWSVRTAAPAAALTGGAAATPENQAALPAPLLQADLVMNLTLALMVGGRCNTCGQCQQRRFGAG